MSSSTRHEPSSREDRINQAIAAYLQAAERGEQPDKEEFLAWHAEIAAELKSFFANQAGFQHAASEMASCPLEPRLAARGSAQPLATQSES